MGRYTMGATVRDVIYIFTMPLSCQWSSSQKESKLGVRRRRWGSAFLCPTHPSYLSGCGCHDYLTLSTSCYHCRPHYSGHAAHRGGGSG
jgi:hypothetical protein